MDSYRRRVLQSVASQKLAAVQSITTSVDTREFYKPGTKFLNKGFKYAQGGIVETATGKVFDKPL